MTKDGTDVVEPASESIGTSFEQTLCWKPSGRLRPVIPAQSRAPVAADNPSRAG
jgi:hypothetical protein